MRFSTMLLTALAVCAMSVQAGSEEVANIDSATTVERVVSDVGGSPSFAVRDSSLMAGVARMRHHVKRCPDAKNDKSRSKKHSHKKASHGKKKSSKGKSKKGKSKKSSKSKSGKGSKTTSRSKSHKTGTASSALGDAKGLSGMTFEGQCKHPGASDKFPNGNIDFLNCGLSKNNPSGRWAPPHVKLSQLKFISSHQASSSSVFKPCAKYESAFDHASSQTGVPAVLLMAFAMQESTCQPGLTGPNGEIGMMQLTPDKCRNDNCWNASTNILMGAKYFKSQLDSFGGNALQALGSYNGWQKGMTYSRATSQQYGCYAQNNLDYLHQMLNGWVQGKTGYELKVYNNLARCG